jgi:hypothetical protein
MESLASTFKWSSLMVLNTSCNKTVEKKWMLLMDKLKKLASTARVSKSPSPLMLTLPQSNAWAVKDAPQPAQCT